jgi:presenilin-like A22 family membrane protease
LEKYTSYRVSNNGGRGLDGFWSDCKTTLDISIYGIICILYILQASTQLSGRRRFFLGGVLIASSAFLLVDVEKNIDWRIRETGVATMCRTIISKLLCLSIKLYVAMYNSRAVMVVSIQTFCCLLLSFPFWVVGCFVQLHIRWLRYTCACTQSF